MKMKIPSLWLVFWILFPVSASQAAIRTYPGAIPCNTTLQACIDGVDDADIIEIATNNRINEEPLNIQKNLTLRPASGFLPLIGNPNPATPNQLLINDGGSGSAPVVVNLFGIDFDGMKIDALYDDDAGSELNVADCRIFNTSGFGLRIQNQDVGAFALVSNNFISAQVDGILFEVQNAGANLEAGIFSNTITTQTPATSNTGIFLRNFLTGITTAFINNNLIYGIGDGMAGNDGCIYLQLSDAAETTAIVTNNTVDNCLNSSVVIAHSPNSITHVQSFNNIYSTAPDGIHYLQPPTDPDTFSQNFDNFFDLVFTPLHNTQTQQAQPGPGSKFEDPLYQNPAAGNYRLQRVSPLINAGTNTPPSGLAPKDRDELPRLVGDAVDMGSYEAQADVALAKTVSPADVTTGGEVTYTLTVQNNGPYETEVTLSDSLPGGAEFLSATPSQGSCDAATPLSCALGVLTNGTSATVTVVVALEDVGSALNNAIAQGDVPDPNPGNNTASASVTVTEVPPTPPPPDGGGCGLQGKTQDNPSLALFLSLGVTIVLIAAPRLKLRR